MALNAKQPNGAPKKEIWTSLLNSVSSGKRLEEKQLLLLGGTPESQRDFLSSLSTESSQNNPSRSRDQKASVPVANQFALGYTYQDVLDADHQDILARLSVYTLSKPSPHFISLLEPLFTPETIPNMLLVILLDWSDPWNWVRELRAWIRILNNLLGSLYNEAKLKVALDENINKWRDRKRRITSDPTSGDTNSSIDIDVTLPLGPGDWDRPLGVPLSVVCQNANKIETLEKESGWKDRHFDYVQQFVRTVILKHGGSLIYTMPNLTESESTLQTLIHTTLGVQSMLQKKTLKHNTTDRDHIVVPPNFDSWGKIRILTDNFNIEAVSQAWDRDIVAAPSEKDPYNSAVSMYQRFINSPKKDLDMPDLAEKENEGAETESRDTQAFLGEQAEILEELTKEDERNQLKKGLRPAITHDVEEHIGPVQFNMGGIQMDAEDLVKRLKDREANRGSEAESPKTPTFKGKSDNDETENAKLANFFAGLIKKPGGSATNSPRRTGEGH